LANGRHENGFRFLLRRPTNRGRYNQDDPEIQVQCFARTLMATQRDFQGQKGRLQEEHEAAGQEVIFYPKFHCKLNFIKKIWCSCKAYTRDHCTFTIQGLRKILPEAIKSVSTVTINQYYHRCMRTLDAYFTSTSMDLRSLKTT
jgi:hypothetical protein